MQVPYTFRDLRADLVEIRDDEQRSQFVEWHSLIPTLGGVKTDMLVIQDKSPGTQQGDERPTIVFSARVHPGEKGQGRVMFSIEAFMC